MQRQFCAVMALCATACVTNTQEALAAIGASVDSSQPGQSTVYGLAGFGQFQVTEDVALDFSSGPWRKELLNNTGQGIASGSDRAIVETLTNVGAVPWTDWHEHVVSTTNIGGGPTDDAPGFLFRENSVSLQADYGSGLVNLVQGTHYTLVPTNYSGPPMGGNNFNWQAIDIFFAPGFEIATGDRLLIHKNIFEVFGDANIWMMGEAAVIAEYPTPEPASITVVALGALAMLPRLRRA